MKAWMKKLLEQINAHSNLNDSGVSDSEMTEDRATLLFVIDTYNKHLFETDKHPVRKVRDLLDGFAREFAQGPANLEDAMFRFRQWFSSYRIDEYTYIQSTFDDFKKIIWDFADHLSDDLKEDRKQDEHLKTSLNQLREAVEANSIDSLRSKSREFINNYIEIQSRKDERKQKRLKVVRSNLNNVKKKLSEVNKTMRLDHLTGAFNRKCFDEHLAHCMSLNGLSATPMSMLMLDIDHFKKINDSYGHKIGDIVLQECVKMLKQVFNRQEDFLARIGGEEFAVLLPESRGEVAALRAEDALARIRKEVILYDKFEIKFTISIGVAELLPNESGEQWMKRADAALYHSKNSGRNRLTMASQLSAVA